MVVDLGGTIGKVAIATKNLGATDVADYGTQISSETNFDPASLNLTDGWYVPTIEELAALKDKLQRRSDYTGFEYTVGESVLFLPGSEIEQSGKIMYCGKYMSSSKPSTIYHSLAFTSMSSTIHTRDNSGQQYPATIRLFHKMPQAGNNQILYRSANHQVVTLNTANYFGVTVTSNTYDAEADYGVITFSGELTTIGKWAFTNCANLTAVVWPSTMTSIGDNAFQGCAGMAELTIPSTVTSIGGDAFNGCTNLTKLTISKGSIGDDAFRGCTKLSSITLQEGVTSIGGHAFDGCTSLAEFILPSTITDIGQFAFNGCSSLSSIIFPKSVTSVGGAAFLGCTNLKSVIWNAKNCNLSQSIFDNPVETFVFGDSVQVIPSYICKNLNKLTSIVFPNTVTSIGSEAFYNCNGLDSISIPNTITSIGYMGFAFCSRLKSITFPSSITSIGERAFSNCVGLTELTIPSTVESIGLYAFKNCTGLTSITISNGVKSIDNFAFSYCSNVKSVTLFGVIAFQNIFEEIGTAESPALLKLPSTWPIADRPVNNSTLWHGGVFNCEYIDPVKDLLGDLVEPCDGCPAVTISNGETTIKLYNPTSVSFERSVSADN